ELRGQNKLSCCPTYRRPVPGSHPTCASQSEWRGGRDLNPRGMYSTPTHLAGGRTRPGYATSPHVPTRCYSFRPVSANKVLDSGDPPSGGGRGIRTPG